MRDRFVVDYQVLGACNLSCDFCDGAPKEFKGQPTKVVLEGIDKLAEAGVSTIVFTGGEPLLRKDMPALIHHAKRRGLDVYLSTNGLLLFRVYDAISTSLDCLGLPLDGSNVEMNVRMTRGPKQFPATENALRYFKAYPPTHLVKVGTVVSRVNYDDVPNIGRFLFENPDICHPDAWRLYEFTPVGDGLLSRKRHEISPEAFLDLVARVKALFPSKSVSHLTNEASDQGYIFVNPLQEVDVYDSKGSERVGNLQFMSVDEVVALRSSFRKVVDRISENRSWLHEQ